LGLEGDRFKIYVDRLQNGEVEQISERISPDFLELAERDLRFEKDIALGAEAYLAEDTLILHLNIEAIAEMPCAICNRMTNEPIRLKGLYHTVPLASIKSAVYDYRDSLREAILLEVPAVAECHEGSCPERKEIGKYFRSPSKKEDEYHPFENLEIENSSESGNGTRG